MAPDLNERSREELRIVVEAYVDTGQPIGSRSLSRKLGMSLSPATIRNVMADLEETGLLYAPHTSAGRLPTDAGLQLFVDGILDIEFVSLGPGRALVVIVNHDGLVENRVIDLPLGMPASSLIEASNFFSAHVAGRTLNEAQDHVRTQIAIEKAELDELSRSVVEAGLATWSNAGIGDDVLIVRGQANLLEDVTGMADLERIRALFQKLETNEALLSLIEATEGAQGVQIFIGADNELFSLAGCSVIIAPFSNSEEKIVGAIGVVGPARMNYGRIIPMVDYTAKIVGGSNASARIRCATRPVGWQRTC